MKLFQVGNAVVNDLDLLFNHGHTLGKIVVFPDFTGEVFQLRFRNRLLPVQFGVHGLSGLVAGIDGAKQSQPTRDNSYNDCLRYSTTSQA